MKYMLEFAYTNRITNEVLYVEKAFDTKEDAEKDRIILQGFKQSEEYISWDKVIPLVKCDCGTEILCRNFTNTCENCETDYNFSGQKLADRSQWGEETGENWQDCY